MGILTALFLIAVVSAVVDTVAQPHFWFAQTIPTRKLVPLAV